MHTADLLHLRNDIRNCTSCDLRKTANCPVPWSGPTPAKYLFIGMAPGVEEDKQGQPFVGRSGNLLRYWLKEAGFVGSVAFANAVSCFPGRNKQKGGDNEPTQSQLEACRTNLTRQINAIRPEYLFLVGRTALQAFRPDLTLGYVHGRPLFYDGRDLGHHLRHVDVGLPVWTIYHPAASLRSLKYERLIKEDLRTFVEWVDAGEPWPDTCYVCSRDVHVYDAWGFPYCELHAMRQQKLL